MADTSPSIEVHGLNLLGDCSGESAPQVRFTEYTKFIIPPGKVVELISTAPITEIRWRTLEDDDL